MPILIFDIAYSGHHSEYISHIVSYIRDNFLKDYYFFILHPKFPEKFPAISSLAQTTDNIYFITISQSELNKISKGNFFTRSINSFKIMDFYAIKHHAQKVYLLNLNIFQVALSLYRPDYEISGILFTQFVRMERNTLLNQIKYWRKYLLTRLMRRNQSIKRIFILNDIKAVNYLNVEFKTLIFKSLPDPVPIIEPLTGLSLRKTYDINNERTILLHFGSLGRRKGTFEVLKSLYFLECSETFKIALLIFGKTNSGIDKRIRKRINSIRKKLPSVMIIYHNEFVATNIMKSIFDQCDMVLIPYKNVESSSGVLGHAIASNKPVLGTRKGLLGELIEENKAGITIPQAKAKYIAKAIQANLIRPFLVEYNPEFLKRHSPMEFSRILLN